MIQLASVVLFNVTLQQGLLNVSLRSVLFIYLFVCLVVCLFVYLFIRISKYSKASKMIGEIYLKTKVYICIPLTFHIHKLFAEREI